MNNPDDFSPSSMTGFLPDTHRFYLYVDMKHLMEFPEIAEYLIEEFNKKQDYRSFVENTSINPITDVDYLSLSQNRNKDNKERHTFMTIFHGTYNKKKLLAGFEKKENESHDVYVSHKTGEPLFLSCIDDSLLGFGNSKENMVDMSEKKNSTMNNHHQNILSASITKNTIVGAGVIIDNIQHHHFLFRLPFNIFTSMDTVSLFLHREGEDYIMTARLVYKEKEYNILVSGLVRGAIGILSHHGEFKEIKEFLDHIIIREEPGSISLLLHLTKKNIATLFHFLKEKNFLHKGPVPGGDG
jgi:hypothetical protein